MRPTSKRFITSPVSKQKGVFVATNGSLDRISSVLEGSPTLNPNSQEKKTILWGIQLIPPKQLQLLEYTWGKGAR